MILVGRDAELAALAEALDGARRGLGGVVFLGGPPGIGKTRLAEELERLASDSGVRVVRGRCPDEEGVPPLWPWQRILTAVDAEATHVRSALAALPDDAAEAAAARFRLVEAVTGSLISAASSGPLLVVLEDLHWADEGTLRVLRHVAAEACSVALLLLVTYRPDEQLAPTLADVSRERRVEVLELGDLDPDAVTAMLAETTASPDALVDAVMARTGGRPLLVRAVARSLAGGPAPDPADPQLWDRIAAAADVRRFAAAALARLDPTDAELIGIAAIVGEDIDPTLLSMVTGIGDQEVARRLSAAVGAGLLADGWRFAHALVRDAVVADIPPSARQLMHRRIAQQFDTRRDARAAAEAAAHWLRAGPDPDVVRHAVTAARRAAGEASRRFDDAEAVRLLTAAVAASGGDEIGDAERAGLLLQLATSQFRTGAVRNSARTADAAAAAAALAGRDEDVAHAALAVQGTADPEASATIERLVELALERPGLSLALRARLHAQRAAVMLDRLDTTGMHEAAQESATALRLAEESGDDLAVLDAIRARSLGLTTPDTVTERLRLGAEAIRRAEPAGQPMTALWAHLWRADAAFMLGNLPGTETEVAQAGALAEHNGLLLGRWHWLRAQAALRTLAGDFEAGRALSDEAGDLAARLGDGSATGLSWAYLAMAATIKGDPAWLPEEFHENAARVPPVPITLGTAALGQLLHGRTDDAHAVHRRMRGLIRSPIRDPRWGGVLTCLIHLVEAFQDVETAEALYTELVPWNALAGGWGSVSVIMFGSVHRELGRMAVVLGQREEAVRLFRQAVEANVSFGARPHVALSRLDLAGVLARGASPQQAEALGLARQAARELRRLGMTQPLTRADRLTAELEAAARRQDPLSSREHEVAELVARALTNREIADSLVLSERTVESHVRSILTKLGFTSRTEIAGWWLRRDHARPHT